MPPKAQPPPRGVWANANTNSLQFCTSGGLNDTINNVANQIFDAAHQALTRTTPGAVLPTFNMPGAVDLNEYRVWFVFDQRVADELRRVYAVAPVRNTALTSRTAGVNLCRRTFAVCLTTSVALAATVRTMPSSVRALATTRL